MLASHGNSAGHTKEAQAGLCSLYFNGNRQLQGSIIHEGENQISLQLHAGKPMSSKQSNSSFPGGILGGVALNCSHSIIMKSIF